MEFIFLFYALIAVVTLFYLFLKQKLKYWKNRNVPYVEPEFFYGNSRGINNSFHLGEFTKRIYIKLKPFGPIGGMYMFTHTVAIPTDLDLIKNILVKDFNNFPNRGLYYNEKDDPLSAHLVNIEDDPWRQLRHKISPTFTSGKLKMMFGTIADVADRLIATVQKETLTEGQLEVKDVMSRFTTDVIGSTAFGIECNSLEDKTTKFYEMGVKAFRKNQIIKKLFLMTYPNLARRLHIKLISKEIREFFTDVVSRTISYREENPQVQRNDFMNLLINLKNKVGPESLTFHQIASQTLVFFLAGYETSSTTLTYSMYELAIHEDIQRKARESVKEVLGKHGNKLTYDAVNDMQYLEQCVYEALRMYPPSGNTQRVCKEDYPIPGTKIVIEKGISVIIPIYGIHHDPDIYPQPEKYDPDRFSPEQVSIRHPFAFIPFGEGPRICIGMKFALVEVKLALAKILMNFEFSLDRSKTSVPLKFMPGTLIMTPAEGIFINFKSLSGHSYNC